MPRTLSQRLTIAFAVSMAVLMAVTLFLPALTPDLNQPQPQELPPTPTIPPPTLPPPLTDFSGINFTTDYLHPSGLFSLRLPTSWEPGTPTQSGSDVRVSMNNAEQLSVIEVSVESPSEAINSMDELSARFTSATLASGWRTYAAWEELTRRIEDDRLIIDYALSQNRQDFLARDRIWMADDQVYRVRVVVPANARDLLFHMIDAMADNFNPYTQFAGTPVDWEGYFDREARHIVRYPSLWNQTDGAPGAPASFLGDDGTLLRVEAREMTIEDEESAAAFVESLRSGIETLSVEPAERRGGEGFSVAYAFTDPDGERRSGLALLLNGEDGLLHIADALLAVGGIDLNDEEQRAPHIVIAQIMQTFSLLTDIDLREPVPEIEEVIEPETDSPVDVDAPPMMPGALDDIEGMEDIEIIPEPLDEDDQP